ncbi:MAG TPA: NAD(+)/NADH kinase [Acidimicrobiia bacterium]
MKFALQVRTGRPRIAEFAERLKTEIEKSGGSVVEEGVTPDMMLAVGGDGTMLGAVYRAVGWDIPVLGFNLGTLGFLTEAQPEDMRHVVERLFANDYDVDERMTIEASKGGDSLDGINDVVVEKIESTRLVHLEVVVDGTPFTTYRADGLIVATPTGSTAYSFSAGGPIVDPGVAALVLTPVAAHSLFDRPIVLPADAEIVVTVRRDRPVRVNVDKSVLGELGDGDRVVIRRGPRPARFVTFNTVSFPGLVRNKFGLD